jgi:hypothetical protein
VNYDYPRQDLSLMEAISGVAFLAAGCIVMWALALILLQVLGWAHSGQWQPVPAYALFITEQGQAELRVFRGPLQALNIVPAWGSGAWHGEGMAYELAGNFLGLKKVYAWMLNAPLVGWLFASAFVLMFASAALMKEAH